MKKKLIVLCCILFLANHTVVFAKQAPDLDFIHSARQIAEAKKIIHQPFIEQLMTHSLEHDSVENIKVENNSGLQRVFSINDGFQEIVLRKVIYWLNHAERVNGTMDVNVDNPSNKLTLNMANGEVVTIVPAYTCTGDNKCQTCTAKEGEFIVSENKQKVRLKSQSLYDWLIVGWRKEVEGLTKEELLEEALYTRYLDYLGPSYAEYFMCPKIKIEPIDGDPSRHLIYGSALNYSGHHGGDYHKLTFSVSDSNITGLQVTNVKIKEHISEKESEEQCRMFD